MTFNRTTVTVTYLVPLHGDPQALLALALDVLLQRVVGVCTVTAGVVTVAAGPRGARDGGPILLEVGGDSLLAATVASATALKMAGRATVAVLTKRMAEPWCIPAEWSIRPCPAHASSHVSRNQTLSRC